MPEALRTLVTELRQVVGVPEMTIHLPIDVTGLSREEVETRISDYLNESRMDPFKRKGTLGPGPRKRTFKKRKKDRFRCKCSNQGGGLLCACKTRRGVKNVFVSLDYKNYYNGIYRAWVKKRRKAPKKKSAAKKAA